MVLPQDSQKAIDDFLRVIDRIKIAYSEIHFSYVAVRQGSEFLIARARLGLFTIRPVAQLTQFESESVVAGCFKLSDLGYDVPSFVRELATGAPRTPGKEVKLLALDNGEVIAQFVPVYPEGGQQRLSVLVLNGKQPIDPLSRSNLDWEVRAAAIPYTGLDDIAHEYQCGAINIDHAIIEVMASNVAVIGGHSTIDGTRARLTLHIAANLPLERASMGLLEFANGRCINRKTLASTEFSWETLEGVQSGTVDIEVSLGSMLQCIANYGAVSQHYWWVVDPMRSQNPRRLAFEVFDDKLAVLSELLNQQSRGAARDLEAGVAWLFWMLGFGVAHLGSTSKLQDAVDIFVTAPSGGMAVVECTTGMLREQNKMMNLIGRTQAIRRKMTDSGQNVPLLPIMVTSRTRAEIEPELEQAEKLGIVVMANEEISSLLNQTTILPNADQMYQTALDATKSMLVPGA